MAACFLVAGLAPGVSELTLELVDSRTGTPVHGLVRITVDGKEVRPEGLLNRGEGLNARSGTRRWWVVPGRATVTVPAGEAVVEAFHGLTTKLARVKVEGKEVRIPLERFVDPDGAGYRNGNTHIHIRNLTEEQMHRHLREIPRADGLEAVYVSHLERKDDDRTYISNALTRKDLEELSGDGVVFGNGEEHRHNFGPWKEGYGHVMFLDLERLVQPVSIGPGISGKGTDGSPLRRGIEAARDQGATVVWCHNGFGLEDIPTLTAGKAHALNIFDGGTHGSYADTYYRYLNAGLRVPFSTGTDWFIYDFSRVYARAASPERFLEGLRAGRTYITNGPLFLFEVNRKEPGGTVDLDAPGSVQVTGLAVGRSDFGRVELVRNGVVVRSVESRGANGSFEARMAEAVEVGKPCWLALRVPPVPEGEGPKNLYGRTIFAHTSAVTVRVGGRGPADPEAVRGLLEEVKRDRAALLSKGTFGSEAERTAVTAVYDEAIRLLESRLR